MLPPAYERALDEALAGLSIELTAGARTKIGGHVRLLLAWNAAINLTAIRDPAEIAVRHVADSLTGLGVLRERGIDRFVDLGSGAGFPGLTLAAALPAADVLLVESVGKKARFLETVVQAIGLAATVDVAAERGETLAGDPTHRFAWPAVLVRAVATLPDLIELAMPLLSAGGVLVAWKRGDPADPAGLGGELEAGRRALAAIGDGRIEVRDVGAGRSALRPVDANAPDVPTGLADHCLVIVERGRRPIDASWPRDPAARRRHPW